MVTLQRAEQPHRAEGNAVVHPLRNPGRKQMPDQRREHDPGNTSCDADSATLGERGRMVLGGVAAAADRAGEALSEAQDHLEGLSDIGVLAVGGFAVGVTTGLLLAGAAPDHRGVAASLGIYRRPVSRCAAIAVMPSRAALAMGLDRIPPGAKSCWRKFGPCA